MYNFILNIFSIKLQHKNENKQFVFDLVEFQLIKDWGSLLYFDTFYDLILAAYIVIYLSFVIISIFCNTVQLQRNFRNANRAQYNFIRFNSKNETSSG